MHRFLTQDKNKFFILILRNFFAKIDYSRYQFIGAVRCNSIFILYILNDPTLLLIPHIMGIILKLKELLRR